MLRGLGGLCLRLAVDVNPSSHEVLNEITPPLVRLITYFGPRDLRNAETQRRSRKPKATIHAPHTKHHELYFVLA